MAVALPACAEGSSRSASGSDPSACQSSASALGIRACKNLHVPFKSRVSVSYSSLDLLNASLDVFKTCLSGGLSSLCRISDWGP